MGSSSRIDCIIFDLDGLLLDTEPLYQKAIQAVCTEYGKEYTEDLRRKVMGQGEIAGASLIVNTLQLPFTPEAFLERRHAHLLHAFPKAELMPGARALIEHLLLHGFPLALATSSRRCDAELKMSSHMDLFSKFEHIICGDNSRIKACKPAPDIYLLTAEIMKVEPSKCLVFEDSPSGVRAGLAAGMKTVAVPDPTMPKELYEGAHAVLNSLEDFDPKTFPGVPLF